MKKYYQAVLAGIGTNQIDIAFPDFPGCVTVAANIDDVYLRGTEALSFHLQSMIEDGDALPAASKESALLQMLDDYEQEGYRPIVAFIGVDIPVPEPSSTR